MKFFPLFLLPFLLIGRTSSAQSLRIGADTAEKLPQIPATLTEPSQRAGYLAAHYWDAFDFNDEGQLSDSELLEPFFADFITVLPLTPEADRLTAVATLLRRALNGADPMFSYFAELFEKYLWETESPLHNTELYLTVLHFIVESPAVGETHKLRPRALLKIAERNRTGQLAEDFGFVRPDGHEMRLWQIEGDYLLLFFNSPDCAECLLAKSALATSSIIGKTPGLNILSIYPRGEESVWRSGRYPAAWINGRDAEQAIDAEGLYDLRKLPLIYLLDRKKCVLLKDASVREVETFLINRTGR